MLLASALVTGACGDRCEVLCGEVSTRLDECLDDSTSWADLGARSQADWRRQCRRDWDRTSSDLSSRELELALDVCRFTIEDVRALSCDEVRALYVP